MRITRNLCIASHNAGASNPGAWVCRLSLKAPGLEEGGQAEINSVFGG